MSKKKIVNEQEITYKEIIKIGSEPDAFDDQKRQNALKGSFGRYINFVKGPSVKEKDFSDQLINTIRSMSDLVAIEVSPSLDERDIRLIIEKSMGTLVIQPQFANSVFIRYISFGLGELTVRPVDLSAIYI